MCGACSVDSGAGPDSGCHVRGSELSPIKFYSAKSIAVENANDAGEVAYNKSEAQAKGIERYAFSNALRLRIRLVSPVSAHSDGKSGAPIHCCSNSCRLSQSLGARRRHSVGGVPPKPLYCKWLGFSWKHCLNSPLLGLFLTSCGPSFSGHGYATQSAANTSCPRSDRFWLRELRVSRHFSTFYGPSVQAMDT